WRIVPANRVVKTNDPAPALLKLVERGAVLRLDRARLGGKHNEHIRLFQLRRRRKIHRTAGLGSALAEQVLPFRQKPPVIMLARAMILGAAPDEYPQWRRAAGQRASNE